jgi:pimeloyl-ACP methyl ester carboxylesterase
MRPAREQFATLEGVRLCYETFGDESQPALLLVMGLGTQMIGWDANFCSQLADRGFFVVRYDNRDVGRSTHLTIARRPLRARSSPVGTAIPPTRSAIWPTTASGCSTSWASTPPTSWARRWAACSPNSWPHGGRIASGLSSQSCPTPAACSGQPALRLYPSFLAKPPRSKEEYVERLVKIFGIIGSRGFERAEDDLRLLAETSFDRGANAAGSGRQLAAIQSAGSRLSDLRRIKAPTLVIHGKADLLVRPSGGRATARAIPNARLQLIDGMGHDLPRGAWPEILDGIVRNAATGSTLVAA